MCFDEGGMILYEPINEAKGKFAMIGVGEKGCADLKFIARSKGGRASIPGKNTPLVRMGKFMAKAEKHHIFPVDMNPAVCELIPLWAFQPFRAECRFGNGSFPQFLFLALTVLLP